MNFQLTKEQLAALVKLVYLGNRMANDWRTDDVIEEYDEVESLVLEAAQKHGLGDTSNSTKSSARVANSALKHVRQKPLFFRKR